MRDKRKRPVDERRKLILNKRLEQRPEHDFRQDCVAGLFQAEDQLFVQSCLAQEGALPEALLHPKGVEQDDPFHSHVAHRPEHSPQHLGPRQGEDKRHGQRRRRRTVEAHLHLQDRFVQDCHTTGADAASRQPHAEFIVDRRAVDGKHVSELGPEAARGSIVYEIVWKQ
jgi:hypothetical protein